ncbi:exported hypothetical protein [Candidatus Sulfopaludibacter sp. SbA4]|nr:exported hypothetical protein [Candidatus Sulfopaludibacter sp. SbA4]
MPSACAFACSSASSSSDTRTLFWVAIRDCISRVAYPERVNGAAINKDRGRASANMTVSKMFFNILQWSPLIGNRLVDEYTTA